MSAPFLMSDELLALTLNKSIKHGMDLLSSGRYSDLTVRCGDNEWKVHKYIVCTKSDFFAKAVDGDFKEAHTGIIDLPDDKPETVHRMLQYLYTGTYDDEIDEYWGTTIAYKASLATNPEAKAVTSTEGIPCAPESAVGVYVIADKYLIPGLKKLGICRLKAWSLDDIDWPAAARIVDAIYTNTNSEDEGMRSIAMEMVMSRYPNWFDDEVWSPVFLRHPDLMATLLRAGTVRYRELWDTTEELKEAAEELEAVTKKLDVTTKEVADTKSALQSCKAELSDKTKALAKKNAELKRLKGLNQDS